MVILLLQMHRNFQSGQPFRAAPCSSPLLNTEPPVCTHGPGTHFRHRAFQGPGIPRSPPGEAGHRPEPPFLSSGKPLAPASPRPHRLVPPCPCLIPGPSNPTNRPQSSRFLSILSRVTWVILPTDAPRTREMQLFLCPLCELGSAPRKSGETI